MVPVSDGGTGQASAWVRGAWVRPYTVYTPYNVDAINNVVIVHVRTCDGQRGKELGQAESPWGMVHGRRCDLSAGSSMEV